MTDIGKSILDLPMRENDSGEDTVKGYLTALLWELWWEEESFSGKRPFGNSGWKHDLYQTLIEFKFVEGEIDADGYIVGNYDKRKANQLISEAIEAL